MADDSPAIALDQAELRVVTAYAVACALPALAIFERTHSGVPRPRAALEAAEGFASGGERTKALRDSAWTADRAARETRDAGHAAAGVAVRRRQRGRCRVPAPAGERDPGQAHPGPSRRGGARVRGLGRWRPPGRIRAPGAGPRPRRPRTRRRPQALSPSPARRRPDR
ncbi:putative immunity protein [Amycolatopsis sp. FDAARGOS 1241]|uniref:putative immunity protein n=1 Tax=Amycolatopsis sp. FDAARGOS 1241 TaxID=2778070 RepID=UPI00351C9C13